MLAVVYVMFNEGFVSSTGATQDRDLAADAVWLAGVVATSLPREAEAWGLAALLTLQHARSRARFDEHGGAGAAPRPGPVPLGRRRRSPRATGCSSARPRCGRPAATSSRPRSRRCTRPRPSWAETDWLQIVTLYELLAAASTRRRSPGSTAPSRSPSSAGGRPRRALADLEALAEPLAAYHLFHATRAELLTALGP